MNNVKEMRKCIQICEAKRLAISDGYQNSKMHQCGAEINILKKRRSSYEAAMSQTGWEKKGASMQCIFLMIMSVYDPVLQSPKR